MTPRADDGVRGRWPEVLAVFLRLGLTSFGGPIAHLGYFREEFVVRRRWLTDRAYADLVALCQFLPGPASSQVGIAIGLSRAGYAGALAAWTGFTLPSAILLVLFAYGIGWLGDSAGSGWLHGLKVAAVAVVAQAVLGMMRTLAPDRPRATLAVVAAVIVLAVPSTWGQVGAILLGGIVGHRLPARWPADRSCLVAAEGRPHDRRHAARRLLCAARRASSARLGMAGPEREAGRRLLSSGRARLRRRACRAPAPAGVRGAARLGQQRRLPRRLRRRAGGSGSALHLRRLSRRRHGAAAQWGGRGGALSRGGVPSVLPADHRRPAVLGRYPAARRGSGSACAASMRRSSVCCSRPSTIRSGRRASPAPPTSPWQRRPFFYLFVWKTPPWLVVVLSAIGGAAIQAIAG